jgi:hypothetical protein
VLRDEKLLLLAFVRCSLPHEAAAARGLLLLWVLLRLTSSSTEAADLYQQTTAVAAALTSESLPNYLKCTVIHALCRNPLACAMQIFLKAHSMQAASQ